MNLQNSIVMVKYNHRFLYYKIKMLDSVEGEKTNDAPFSV